MEKDFRKRSLNFHRFLTIQPTLQDVALSTMRAVKEERETSNTSMPEFVKWVGSTDSFQRQVNPGTIGMVVANLASVPISVYPRVMAWLSAGEDHPESRILSQRLVSKICECGNLQYHFRESADWEQIWNFAARFRHNLRPNSARSLRESVSNAYMTFHKAAPMDSGLQTHMLHFLCSVPVPFSKSELSLIRLLNIALTNAMQEASKPVSGKPVFSPSSNNASVDASALLSRILLFEEAVSQSQPNYAVGFVSYSRALNRFIEANFRKLDQNSLIDLIIKHSQNRPGPLPSAPSVLRQIVRSYKRIPARIAEPLLLAAAFGGYRDRFSIRRVERAAGESKAEVSASLEALIRRPALVTLLNHDRRMHILSAVPERLRSHRAGRRLIHRIAWELNPGRLREYPETIQMCSKRECTICRSMNSRLELVRAFHS